MTLRTVSTARTRIEQDFDPGAVRRLEEQTARDIGVGGPDLAGQALRAGVPLELLRERRSAHLVVHLRSRTGQVVA